MGKICSEVEKKFTPFMQKLLSVHGDNVLSVYIFGSAASADFNSKTSDINSAFVLKNLDFQALNKSLKIVQEGLRKKIVAPLFVTKEYIQSSLDVFPIEFLEMKENNVVLFGEDVLSDLEIKGEHIRLFCEQQVKGKLIRIRQTFLEVGLKKKGIEALIKESLNSLFPVFRNLLKLKGVLPQGGKEHLLVLLCEAFDLDKDVWVAVYRDKENDEKIAGKDIIVFLEKYLEQIEKLASGVDKL